MLNHTCVALQAAICTYSESDFKHTALFVVPVLLSLSLYQFVSCC